ncbi:hypothetical protein ACH5RR_006458 [Cinchona calisaya]|uniref:Cytochrome c oxidase subunit n=1 Tax=Cinchona calisaya TaxID=153742 RepID=A0ABD3AP25_9GENT
MTLMMFGSYGEGIFGISSTISCNFCIRGQVASAAGSLCIKKLILIELKTAPADFRFPTTNQTRHCFTRYIEFHRCVAAKGEDSGECEKFAKYYRALCPGEWVEKWNEQRDNGTFPGPL